MTTRMRRARGPARRRLAASASRTQHAARRLLRQHPLAFLLALAAALPSLAACDLKVELASHRFSSGDVAAPSMGLQPPDPLLDLGAATEPAPEQPPPRVGLRIPATQLARELISPDAVPRPPLLVRVAPDLAPGDDSGFGPLVASLTAGLSSAPAHGRATVGSAARRPTWTHADLGTRCWMPHPAPPKPAIASRRVPVPEMRPRALDAPGPAAPLPPQARS